MDVTTDFYSLLKEQKDSIKSHAILRHVHSHKTTFMKDANSILLHLYKIQEAIMDSRPIYLSSRSYAEYKASEKEKYEIESRLLAMIQSSMERIRLLRSALETNVLNHHDQDHKKNVIFILEHKLMGISTQFKQMQERLLELRSLRMDTTPLTTMQNKPFSISNYEPKEYKDYDASIENNDHVMDASLKALLEQENEQLVSQFENDLVQVEQATQSLQEIADLQSTLAFHLTAQEEMIASIFQDAQDSVQTMERAHSQLVQTKQVFGGPRLWVFVLLIVASSVLLFLDYYGS